MNLYIAAQSEDLRSNRVVHFISPKIHIRNAFEFLLANSYLSGPEGFHIQPNPLALRLQELAAVAIACYALGGPASDMLLDTQACFGPLLLCMPQLQSSMMEHLLFFPRRSCVSANNSSLAFVA